MDRRETEKEIFGMMFKTSNVLQVYLDRLLTKDKLTAKQMFLMIVIGAFGEDYPTLKEVAEKSGSSYQNVKQLALKLEKQGFIRIEQDNQDKRRKNLCLTEQAVEFWNNRGEADSREMTKLFQGFDDDEISWFLASLLKLLANLEKM